MRSISKPKTPREPDLKEAARFLETLDPTATAWTFQTFDDSKNKKYPDPLARTRHGTLEQRAAALSDLNAQGAGVFVVVNETDFKGRSTENITRVRAVFVDLDGAPLEPVQSFGLEPHIIVESSPGRWHAYWRVDDLPRDRFTEVQIALARWFDSDPSVKDLPRVMRLPGFFHCKGEPFQTRMVSP